MTAESDLTDRQAAVLRLVREGKTPTTIGKELDISSQAVHGHLRRLRDHGLIARRARASKAAAPAVDDRPALGPAAVIAAVHAAIADQRAQLDAREAEIEAELKALRDEKTTIVAARRELDKLAPVTP